tara:strand:- start:24469 stop:24885 length:417 start_codon:yes stop_codon:yes gene_type:complete
MLKLFIDPVQSFKATIAEVSNALILYANIYANPKTLEDKSQKKMSEEMRMLSSKLQSNMHLIPIYGFTSWVFGLPAIGEVVSASKNLIFIHNGHDGALTNQGILNCYAAQKAKLSLGIYVHKDEMLDPKHEIEFVKAK